MINTLLVQQKVPHYREPLFEGLSADLNVVVAHAGARIKSQKQLTYVELRTWNFFGLVWFIGLFHLIRKNNTDSIVFEFDLHLVQLFLLPVIFKKKRIILWGHRYSKSRIVNYVRVLLIKRLQGVLLYNSEESKRLVEDGVDEKSIFVAENTIDVRHPIDTSQENKDSLIYVGRAQQRKRVDLLISEFARVRAELNRKVRIVIVGSGQENERLKKLASDVGVSDDVVFTGSITDEIELAKEYSRSFAYVSPYAIGLGAQHSFAYGVPVITSRLGYVGAEYANLIHNGNSLLFESHDQLGDYIVKIVNDNEFRLQLSKSAFKLYRDSLTMAKMITGFKQALIKT